MDWVPSGSLLIVMFSTPLRASTGCAEGIRNKDGLTDGELIWILDAVCLDQRIGGCPEGLRDGAAAYRLPERCIDCVPAACVGVGNATGVPERLSL